MAAWACLGLGLIGHWIAAYNYFWAIIRKGRGQRPAAESSTAVNPQERSKRRRRAPLMVWLAVVLAVAGAFFLAFGAQRQGSAVKADTGGLALSSNGLLRLIRNRLLDPGAPAAVRRHGHERHRPRVRPADVVQPIGAIALSSPR